LVQCLGRNLSCMVDPHEPNRPEPLRSILRRIWVGGPGKLSGGSCGSS
jgi:hypothetical protein